MTSLHLLPPLLLAGLVLAATACNSGSAAAPSPASTPAAGAPSSALAILERARERSAGVSSGSISQQTTTEVGGVSVHQQLDETFDADRVYLRTTNRTRVTENVYAGGGVCVRTAGRAWQQQRLAASESEPPRNLNLGGSRTDLEQLADDQDGDTSFYHLRVHPGADALAGALSGIVRLDSADLSTVQVDLYVDENDFVIKKATLAFDYTMRDLVVHSASVLTLSDVDAQPAFPDGLPTDCGSLLA